MFLDEAKTAAALQHPAIVPTVDLGEHRGMLYIAMDLVKGPSLRGLLQKRAMKGLSLSPTIVAHIGERIAHALDYAYDRAEVEGKKLKLIHRDVSPHNILIDTSGVVRLMDFGVARTAIQDHLSRVGTVRGKPSYMAPEQVTGGKLTARTDVFALGIVLYESACLKRLFGRGEPTKSMTAVLKHTPRHLTEVLPGFPEQLAEIIDKALQKDPEHRQKDAGELSRELGEALRELPSASTVGPDLSDIIAKSFDAQAFDLENKAKEFTQHAMAEPEEEFTRPERPEDHQEVIEEEATRTQDPAFYEALATNVIWPGSLEPNPRHETPFVSHYSEQISPNVMPSRGQVAAVLLLAAFVVSFALILMLKGTNKSQVAAPVVPQRQNTLKAITAPQPSAQVPTAKEEEGKTSPVIEQKEKRSTPNRAAKRRMTRKPGKRTKSVATDVSPRDSRRPATKKEVWGLIQKLEPYSAERSAQYRTTLIEAGGHQGRLNKLRTQVLKELKERSSENRP